MSSEPSDELTLFYFPRACSLAVHIALEESGLAYNRHLVDLRTGQNRDDPYLALNPTGAVPALGIGSRTLTETQAILTFVGDHAKQADLLPGCGDMQRYRAHELMNFLSSSVHTYVRSIFRSSVYGGDDEGTNTAVGQQGVHNLAKAVATLEQRLEDSAWALKGGFSVVDCYLFVMYLWTTDERISAIPARPRWERLAANVWQRPATQSVVEIERRDRDFAIPWEAKS